MIIQVGIPAPVRIRVGIVAQALAVVRAGVFERAAAESFPERAGVRMHAGAIAGNRQAAGRDEAFCHGRAHGGKEQDVLEMPFEISGDVPAACQPPGNLSGNAFVALLRFLPFSLWLLRLPVFVRLEEPGSGVPVGGRLCPEAVHKVIIGAERREGVRRVADEGGKDKVVS